MTCYDVTFCSNIKCKQECIRNQKNVETKEVIERNGIWVGDFPKCEYFKKEEE